jgi:3-oxoadipate enol-lactonase
MIPKLLRPDHDPAVAASVRAIIQESTAGGVAAAQRGMARRRDSTDLLAGIDVPTLVLVGKDDALTTPAVAAEMAAAIAGAKCQVLEGAGHLSNLEAPDAFTAALEKFVADYTV